jgi:hypothetical protein
MVSKKFRYCFWSVVDGRYQQIIETAIRSARQVGVEEEFHVWTQRPVSGAISHSVGVFDKRHYLFKLRFLQEEVRKLDYEYFVWLDADNYFVRNPGDLMNLLRSSPFHVTLESDACCPSNRRNDWWGCPLPVFAALMRKQGVKSNSIFNLNAGFWIVHRDVIDTLCKLAFGFWEESCRAGYTFTEEAPLAYAAHMLCGNQYNHTLARTAEYWASDWTGCYKNRLPDGLPWTFEDYFSGVKLLVNPAIVHAMRSKQAMFFAASDIPQPNNHVRRKSRKFIRKAPTPVPSGNHGNPISK